MVKALFASPQLSRIVQAKKNVGEVRVTRIKKFPNDRTLEFLCGNSIRSAEPSVLKVEIIFDMGPGNVAAVYSATNYFATPDTPENLVLCDTQN